VTAVIGFWKALFFPFSYQRRTLGVPRMTIANDELNLTKM